jgi:hypothetical protein
MKVIALSLGALIILLLTLMICVSCNSDDDDDDDEYFDEDTATEEEWCEHRLSIIGPRCYPNWASTIDYYCYGYQDSAFDFNLCYEDYGEEIMSDSSCEDNPMCDLCLQFNDCLAEQYTP